MPIRNGICRGGEGNKFMIVTASGLAPRYQQFAGGPNILLIRYISIIKPKETKIQFLTEFSVGLFFKAILANPTAIISAPWPQKKDINNAIEFFKKKKLDLLVSVNEAEHNPYFSILEKENKYYALSKGKNLNVGSRQKAKKVFNINTIVWIYSRKAIKQIKKRIPFKTDIIIIPTERSLEINTKADWIKLKKYLNK